MSAGRLVIRADAGPGHGNGHVARCFALAQAWRDRGGTVLLVTDSLPALWADRCRDESIAIESLSVGVDAGHAGDGATPAAWVVLDGYHFGPDEQRAWGRRARLLVIDDHGAAGSWTADLVVDHNLGASAEPYGPPAERPPLLLGARYALLRREFRVASGSAPLAGTRPVERVAVAAGGSPTDDVRDAFDQIEAGIRGDGVEVVRLDQVADVAATFRSVDLVVSAAGGTAWEVCALGLPLVAVPVAENQEPVARALHAAGAAAVPERDPAGHGATESWVEPALRSVRELVASPPRRVEMGQRAHALVDGLGAVRVVTRMLAADLDLRRVVPDDARVLFDWANDLEVRAQAFSPEPIAWDVHIAWLRRQLADPGAALYLASDGEGAVGHVRFAPVRDGLEISVVVAPHRRGEHLGAPLIDAGVGRVCADLGPVAVLARVKPANIASQRAFLAADFDADGSGAGDGQEWLRYTR